MAQRLSETDKAAEEPEKGGEPASAFREKPSGQELARVSSPHHHPGGVRGKGGGWNSHSEPGASTPRGDNEMITTAAVRESEEGNKGSSDRLVRKLEYFTLILSLRGPFAAFTSTDACCAVCSFLDS